MKVCTTFFFLVSSLISPIWARQIKISNNCEHPIWIESLTNDQHAPLPDGIIHLDTEQSHIYQIPAAKWGGRFWPKTGCDVDGINCEVGQSMTPCPVGGCHPPAETKVEFFFPEISDEKNQIYYDVSLVDGFSLAADIVPSQIDDSCTITNCHLSLNNCPSDENIVGNLGVVNNDGQTVMCLSPCKKWNYPDPYGHGQNEADQPGLDFCCPTPPISVEECRKGSVIDTKYVELVHSACPTAYSYAYDDEGGLHHCPSNIDFHVTFCPNTNHQEYDYENEPTMK